jgi:hypothetical protein
MADEGTQNPSAPAAPVVANAGAAPAAETSSPAGSVGGAAPVLSPASTETPAPQPAPVALQPAPAAPEPTKVEGDKPAEPAKVAGKGDQNTLLGAPPEKKTEQPKSDSPPGEVSKDPPEGKETQGDGNKDGSQSAEPAPLPSFEAFKIPENVQLDNERIGSFTTILGEFENTTKAPHAEIQNLGQKLVDFHISEVQNSVDRIQKAFADVWKKQTTDWLDQTRADPEIGGARHETALASAVEIINTYGGNEQQLGELREFFNKTGVGNHPALVRLLHNISKGPLYTEGQPKPAPKAVPEAKSRTQKLYGTNT